MTEKKKSRPSPYEGEDTEPPSPPSRHQKWKLARLHSSGIYTSESAREIFEKIVRYNSYLNSSFMFYIVFFFYKFFCYIVGFVGWADLPRRIHSRRSSWHTCCCNWTTWAPWTSAWCWIRSRHTPIFGFLLSLVFMQSWCWLWTKNEGNDHDAG